MNSFRRFTTQLAAAFCTDRLEVENLIVNGTKLCGNQGRWLRPLANRVVARFGSQARPRHVDLQLFLRLDKRLLNRYKKKPIPILNPILPKPSMVGVFESQAPSIATIGELADAVGMDVDELDWFVDERWRRRNRDRNTKGHYRYRVLDKRSRGIRIIEIPKQRLMSIQRWIDSRILRHVPTHSSSHGFRSGKSTKSNAEVHTSSRIVLRIDLEDFFPTIRIGRVRALYRLIGYPEPIADALARLCTNHLTERQFRTLVKQDLDPDAIRSMQRYVVPHLPQGAASSPSLSNLCAYRLDSRLFGLAQKCDARYTRYADDLIFSGGNSLSRSIERFRDYAYSIILDEGFSINFRKTKIMRAGNRQEVTGVVINDRPNLKRAEYDRLKAILVNCVRKGPSSQNRSRHPRYREHLRGKISHVASLNPQRGKKLLDLFEQIRWAESEG